MNVTEAQAKAAISKNLNRILGERGQSPYWLMTQLEMSPGALYPIVRGKKLPSIATAARIAAALEISVDVLLETKSANSKIPA